MKHGTLANHTGQALEMVVESIIMSKHFSFVDSVDYEQAMAACKRIYTRQHVVYQGIYGTDVRCDFVAYDPNKEPCDLIIEAKWQESSGSVYEKYPYLVLNIKERSPLPTIIVLDGGGYLVGAEEWLRKQVGGQLIGVFTITEFMKWANRKWT